MDRGFFRHWGFDLDDAGFAQALAALGTSTLLPTPDVPAAGRDALTFHADHISSLMHSYSERLDPSISAAAFRDAWSTNARLGARISIQPPGPGAYAEEFDPYWLVDQLSHPAVGARSVFVRQDEPLQPVSWQWPLRLGVLSDPRSKDLRASLDKTPLSQLVEFVDIGLVDTECDLLLLPYNLRTALQRVLSLRTRISADCALVLGGISADPARADSLLATLRSDTRASGVAVLSVPKEMRGPSGDRAWLNLFLTFVSHNEPLDVALFHANRDLKLRPPFLTASGRLLEIARLEVVAARMAAAISALPTTQPIRLSPDVMVKMRLPSAAPPHQLAGELLHNLQTYDWKHESGDATSLVRLRTRVAESAGTPVRLGRTMAKPPMKLALAAAPSLAAPPTSKTAIPETRHLQARILDRKNQLVESALAPSSSYEASVKIADLEGGWIQMPQEFPSYKLPPSVDGHTLTVVFCELRTSKEVAPPPPQMSELHLPPAGSSTVSRFFFRTRKSQKEFRARVLVLFRGRVLQTAILRRAVGESRPDTAVPGLEPETTVRASFEGLSPSRAFDAAIVINHSASGTPGASVITPNSAQFLEPVGLPASLDALRNILTSLTKLAQPPSQLKDDQMVKVLRQLANHGRLMERMFSTANDALSKAHRIQVVEAVRGAFLPVEFFYDGAAPLNSAKLCTGAVAELGDKKDDKNNSEKPPCANPDSNKYTCPTHFWGFSRVVERYTHRNLNRGVYELSEPSQERAKLDVLSRAIVATSAKVSSSDAKKVLDAAKSACGSAEFAQDFDELESKVAATSPTLIILLPHSLPDPDVEGMAALELGDQIRNSAQIDKQHVLGPRSQTGPVVLLLGCSTKLTVVPYQTFVESFKDAGASVVLATMSVIRGRHAAPFTKDLLESIQSCAASGTAVFGDAVLATRRKLLAQGNPFVLTLTAYGDAEWLI